MKKILKAFSWRAIALGCTASVVWYQTGSIAGAMSIGLSDSVIKIGLYYLHECAWDRGETEEVEPEVEAEKLLLLRPIARTQSGRAVAYVGGL